MSRGDLGWLRDILFLIVIQIENFVWGWRLG
jgi:hypothetical protein